MKKFTFSLEQVLDWRRTQARLEEIKLEKLHAERQEFELGLRFLAAELGRVRADLLHEAPISGTELEALDQFRKFTATQSTQLAGKLANMDRQIAAQTSVVQERERDVKVVEKLREQKFREWNRAYLKEIDQQAEESHIAHRR